MTRTTFLSAILAGTLATAASAQDATLGGELYSQRCAICHGDTGSGDGVVGVLFAQPPKDLKLIAQENDGVFPFRDIYNAISFGTTHNIAAHGTSEMPIWGEALMADAMSAPGMTDVDAAALTEGRILSLTHYLEAIQVK